MKIISIQPPSEYPVTHVYGFHFLSPNRIHKAYSEPCCWWWWFRYRKFGPDLFHHRFDQSSLLIHMTIMMMAYYQSHTKRPHLYTKIIIDYDELPTIHTPNTITTHRVWIRRNATKRPRKTHWSTEDKPKKTWSRKMATNTNTHRCSNTNPPSRDAASSSCQIYLAKRKIKAFYNIFVVIASADLPTYRRCFVSVW